MFSEGLSYDPHSQAPGAPPCSGASCFAALEERIAAGTLS